MTKQSESGSTYTIGVVYDVPEQLKNSNDILFPQDHNAEWENEKTIVKICTIWRELGHEVIPIPLDKKFLCHWQKWHQKCDIIHSLVEGFGSLSREAWIPSLCELSGVPYLGPTAFAHSLCMSKIQTKLLCQNLKIPTASFYLIQNLNDLNKIPAEFLKRKHFIKPNGEGSGMGIDGEKSLSQCAQKTQEICSALLPRYPHGILIEENLAGPEYTSSLFCEETFLPVAEIEVVGGIYGLAQKGKDAMEEKVTFPELSPEVAHTIEAGTKKLVTFLKLHEWNRMDWKCDEQGRCYFLECNTLPGLSYYYSVLPKMAQECGITYHSFFEKSLESALKRKNDPTLWYGKTRINNKG